MDYLLDITVSPDRSEWSWKDETDFHDAVKVGKITTKQAEAIRLEGQIAIRLLQEDSSSFYETWEYWLPPKEWQIPGIPLGWDEI
ncbi:hypothetical protein [Bacillus sp. FSL K6-3431]|uniref:hypothetical protein n=1 Tax=Bacillus sp. FSL K6-3431 TaxID=2921500 RepID=UPI0030F66AD3